MTPISASDVAESLSKIPNKHTDTVLAHLATLSPRAADSIREHLEVARQRAAGVQITAEANEEGRKRLQSGGRSRRLPDYMTDTICEILEPRKNPIGFNELFEKVFEELQSRNRISGGEEMLRLRAYEKLQNMVTKGQAQKIGKEYLPTKLTVQATSAWLAEHA